MMQIVWRPKSVADRDRIFDRIAKANPAAALALDEVFETKVNTAAANPGLYKPGRVKGTREIVAHPNYIIVYRELEKKQTLEVVRVLHAAQQWPTP